MDEHEIIKKLESEELTQLNDEEVKFIKSVLLDPLQEFCRREAPFRLREYHGLSDEQIEKLKDGAEKIIRDVIDNCECLCKIMDENLKEYILAEKDEEA